ncbi:LysM peptidoglycan-binding domain-containing protein [Motiliproteus coralliicola]|uniref:LysM peptidoglycan-binding domain-containing protein n=1 Tax=Motiliproteus coralliicola TaxID=2283196 RepID=A0A369WBV4_9GAMM|nr:LysM peptidoglycan-binding domain-containing protein [Motiliproteus coralliicola]RDE18791.1 LysM peptidoglycan-binding domain-containing protein [Motiliproteus coralliicola]
MTKLLSAVAAILLAGSLLFTTSVHADVIELADDHPDQYVVVRGDTLWDISGTFLKSPWLWPKVWSVNPQIDNPHLIFPGDVIYLVYINGQPQLRLKRGPRKLSPEIRRTPLSQAIPTIPLQDIKSFLSDNLIMDREALEKAPYVVAGVNERIVSGAGDKVYARGKLENEQVVQEFFGIYRPARLYVDPDTGEELGFESQSIGSGYLKAREADILTLTLKRTSQEVRKLDRVLPTPEGKVQSVFFPSVTERPLEGKILSVLRGVDKIGQFDVIAINRGQREGVEPGNVFQVYKAGEQVVDPVTKELITLPSERAGLVMVFKTFDKVSYALVMRATSALAVLDEVRSPR